jgi:hypothetical protein
MADEKTKKAIERAALTLRIRNIAHRKSLLRLNMRPHTWCFLRQEDMPEEVICLGIVFHTWPMKKYNMVKFHVSMNGEDIHARGKLTTFSNGQAGIILDKRWAWESLLKEYKGLSAGNV